MRPIRAWDDVSQKMLYSKPEQFDDMLGFRFDAHFETENPIYMWSTGRQDRNGKEIWEGDIVQIIETGFENVNDIDYFEQWLVNKKVISHEIDEDGFISYQYAEKIDIVVVDRFPCYWLKNESFGYEGEDLIDPSSCEVIGNIHDHLHLLGGESK